MGLPGGSASRSPLPEDSAGSRPPLGRSPTCNIASGWECRAAHTVRGGPFWTAEDVSHCAKKKTPKLPIPRRSRGEETARTSLTIRHGGREPTAQSNIFSVHTRAGSSRQQSPMARASLFHPFLGVWSITFPISFSLYLQSESHHHGTPFPPGCTSSPQAP